MKRAAALYVFLTLLVWGIFAFDQGLFHDDAAHLMWASQHAGAPLRGLFEPMVAPTRLLNSTPYILALASPAPAVVLQLLFGAYWLLSALAVFALTRRLFPSSPGLALTSGALAATATSDLLTNSSVGLAYCLSGLTFAAALTAALRFQETGAPMALVAAALLLNAGLLASDGAAPAAALAPLLFLATRGRADRRWAAASACWLLALLPWTVVFLRFLRDPGSYAAIAVAPFDAVRQGRLTAALTAHDFLPWRWAFRRPVWIEHLPPVVPAWVYVLATLAGTAAFVAAASAARAESGAEAGDAERRPRPSYRSSYVAAVLVLMIVATHAAFSGVQLAEVRFRTHLVTRLVAAILVALLAGALASRLRVPRLALVLPALFVGLGIAGGLERQDTYLATWRRQRAELASILEAAPALDSQAILVFSLAPDPGGFQATRVPYLASAWMFLLREDASVAGRTVVSLPGWGADCRAESAGLRCTGGPGSGLYAWDRLVVLRFDPASFRYRLVTEFPESAGAYRPLALIRPAPLPERALSLLAGPRLLASLLPAP
ncbi:MAG: hypothetical protein NEA02_02455 [Thermoanaerobaculia bacterium]|nr:hypothetical protein [Thermoanaerobaculia bacterium]